MNRHWPALTALAILLSCASFLQSCKVTGAVHVPVPAENLDLMTTEIELPYDRSLDEAGAFAGVGIAGDLLCAVGTDGRVTCHGSPTEMVEGAPDGSFGQVRASRSSACATTADGRVTCWGESHEHAAPITTLANVDVGPLLGCGVREDGAVQCWGAAEFVFHALEGAFTQVDVGTDHVCALLDEGRAVCLGPRADAEFAALDQRLIDISVGDMAACGVAEDATVVCWGLAAAAPPRVAAPLSLAFEGDLAGVEKATAHVAGLLAAAAAENDTIRSVDERLTIAKNVHIGDVPGGAFTEVSVGPYDACAVDAEGSPTCWGRCFNDLCEVAPPAVTRISVGLSNACGIEPTGRVACWGRSLRGAAPPAEEGSIWMYFR